MMIFARRLSHLFIVLIMAIYGRILLRQMENAQISGEFSYPIDRPSFSNSAIEIHIFVYGRPNATENLLSQLAAADYSSYDRELPLVIHLDRPFEAKDLTSWAENARVEDIITGFHWRHGPKILDVKKSHVGLKASWITAWPTPKPDDIMIALEDDMEVSPFYFQWLLKMMGEYSLWEADKRDMNLLGVCMSPVTVDEITIRKKKASRKWSSAENVPREFIVYLHALPCSWGAVYFGNQWKDFLSFFSIRGSPPFFGSNDSPKSGDPNLSLPDSLSNSWTRSWKRFMFDFAYGRGSYMLYPNLRSSAGLARTLYLAGEHFSESKEDPLYRRVPLVLNSSDLLLETPWPSYRELPLVDMYGKKRARIDFAEHGQHFVHKISLLGPVYSELAERWTISMHTSQSPCIEFN